MNSHCFKEIVLSWEGRRQASFDVNENPWDVSVQSVDYRTVYYIKIKKHEKCTQRCIECFNAPLSAGKSDRSFLLSHLLHSLKYSSRKTSTSTQTREVVNTTLQYTKRLISLLESRVYRQTGDGPGVDGTGRTPRRHPTGGRKDIRRRYWWI